MISRQTLIKAYAPLLLLMILFVAGKVRTQERLLTAQDLLAVSPTEPDFTFFYGKSAFQFGQLRLPQGEGDYPVVIVIHGGCWMAEYDLKHISPLASAITKLGFATWSLEYRRIGNPGGGWPGTFLDIAEGVDYLQALSSDHRLDLDRVLILGHSAGGHLALWAAARAKLPLDSPLYKPSPLSILGVVSLAGIGDLSRLEFQKGCGDSARKLMGGSPEEFPHRYAQASPLELLPFHVPQILIQGARDPIISYRGAEIYQAAARSKGDRCSLVLLEDAGHFELVFPGFSAWTAVRKALKTALTYPAKSLRYE